MLLAADGYVAILPYDVGLQSVAPRSTSSRRGVAAVVVISQSQFVWVVRIVSVCASDEAVLVRVATGPALTSQSVRRVRQLTTIVASSTVSATETLDCTSHRKPVYRLLSCVVARGRGGGSGQCPLLSFALSQNVLLVEKFRAKQGRHSGGGRGLRTLKELKF